MEKMSVEEILCSVRGHDAGPGCVSEIHLKNLLALNLRKLGGSELAFAPRSYILQAGKFMDVEIQRFVLDFKVSRSLAIVRHVAEVSPGQDQETRRNFPQASLPYDSSPEGLWGRQLPEIEWETGPTQAALNLEAVSAACSVVERAISLPEDRWPLDLVIADEEWALIRTYDTHAQVSGVQDGIPQACTLLLRGAPSFLQLSLLRHNVWALKPSCGQFGRGILLLDRLPARPAQLLDWVASVGRGGQKGGKDLTHGCVLQKVIECPHLLNKAMLEMCETSMPQSLPSLKYNLRMIVLATLRLPCRIWLYAHGFVSVALRAYTHELDPLSHITNLRNGPGNENQRRWPLEDLDRCLQMDGTGSFNTLIRPQVRRVVSLLFHALALQPCSLLPLETQQEARGHRSATGRKVRRFGLDFLIDNMLTVWLIEVNFLKNGYALGHAQSGRAGDAKRAFVDQFMADETLLREAVASDESKSLPSSFEELLPGPS